MTIEKLSYPKVLDEVYAAHTQEISRKIELLSELYQLPTINYELATKDRRYYDYTTTIANFIVLILYSSSKKVFLYTSADSNKSEYYLPATHSSPESTIEDIINSLAQKTIPNIELAEVEPIALLEHTFIYSSDTQQEKHSMVGLAYVARILNFKEIENTFIEGGIYVHFSQIHDILSSNQVKKYSNRAVLETAIKRLESYFQLTVRFPDKEIDTNKNVQMRYKIHDTFIKPILKTFKKATLLDREIFKIIKNPQKFLDASCGDSEMIFNVSKRGAELCVGNDVSWSQISLLLEKLQPSYRFKIIFTNHNICFMPYKEGIFDVAVCKNTLHHLTTPGEFRLALENLLNVSKKVLVIEVENPVLHFFSNLVHKYYVSYLKDAGEFFFTESQFKSAITGCLSSNDNYSVNFFKFRSLHANYLFAEIYKN